MEKIFSYNEDGLSYSVRVFEDPENPGKFQAEITVDEGSMDVNAVYWGDDDFSGPSANLGGPLNMNGGGSRYEGERIQWDDAVALSRPGLGREGEDKETFLQEGQSLTVDLDGLESLDDIDFLGIRATSVNGGGSIKGVSGDPDIVDDDDDDHDDNGDDNGDDDPATYAKVFFAARFDDNDTPIGGLAILGPDEDPQPGVAQLPEDADGTFADYVAFYEEAGFPPIDAIQSVVFYDSVEPNNEAFRVDAPEGGFEDADAILAAYDEAIAEMEAHGVETTGLQIAVLGDGEGWMEGSDAEEDEEDEPALA